MENLFQLLLGAADYLDYILIAGETKAEHLATLGEVLHWLDLAGLRAKRDRCRFMVPSVTYLKH